MTNKTKKSPDFIFKSKGNITDVEIKVPRQIEKQIRKEVIATSGTIISENPKTESEIARDNVREFIMWDNGRDFKGRIIKNPNRNFDSISYSRRITYKQTCERFLEFLEIKMADFMNLNGTCFRIMDKKIKDMKNAIKIYNETEI